VILFSLFSAAVDTVETGSVEITWTVASSFFIGPLPDWWPVFCFLEEPEFDLTTILNGSDGETIVAGAREVVEDISTTMTTFFSDLNCGQK